MRTPVSLVFVVLVITAVVTLDGAQAQPLVFQDDFSGSLEANWTTGTNSSLHPQGATVTLQDRKVRWNQLYDYIETKQSFGGDFKIEADVERIAGSHQCMDFIIEFVEASSSSGIMRFQLGIFTTEAINLGNAPTLSTSDLGDCWDDGAYLEELASLPPHSGTLSLTCQSEQIQVSFKNDTGEEIQTTWAAAGPIIGTRIRIWGSGGVGAERYLDNVRVYDLSADTGYAANGIWKSTNDTGTALSFYLQKYESGSCVVVVTTDGLHYTAFLDENYTDGITASNDITNHGYTLDLSLENATQGTLTVTLPSGAATTEVALQYPDTE